MQLAKLSAAVEAIAPIEGVYVGKPEDKSTWGAHFKKDATEEQKLAVRKLLDEWVPLTDAQREDNSKARQFLASTNDAVMLHLEEVSAEAKTTLSVDDYKALVAKRKTARDSILEE